MRLVKSRQFGDVKAYELGWSTPLEMRRLPDSMETKKLKFHAIHTPGHSKDHVVYHEPDRGILFSGDLYLSDRIKYFRADEFIFEQIESLRKVLQLDFDMLLCNHHPKQAEGKKQVFLFWKCEHEKRGSVSRQIF